MAVPRFAAADTDDTERFAAMSPEERIALCLELCDLADSVVSGRPDSEALRRPHPRSAESIAGRSTWVHSAEVLAVFKMLFFRAKDLVDVERMLQVRAADFDRAFVRAALVELLDEDERIERWDEISARVTL